jgi:hypothetical protein
MLPGGVTQAAPGVQPASLVSDPVSTSVSLTTSGSVSVAESVAESSPVSVGWESSVSSSVSNIKSLTIVSGRVSTVSNPVSNPQPPDAVQTYVSPESTWTSSVTSPSGTFEVSPAVVSDVASPLPKNPVLPPQAEKTSQSAAAVPLKKELRAIGSLQKSPTL